MMIIKDLLVVVRLNADNNKAIQNIERVVRKNKRVESRDFGRFIADSIMNVEVVLDCRT